MTFSSCGTDERQIEALLWCAVQHTVDQKQSRPDSGRNRLISYYGMKMKEETEPVSSRGLLLKARSSSSYAKLAALSNPGREGRIHDGAIVNGCLRSPSATRLSGQFNPRLNGFASLPRDRFAFIGAITLKDLYPPHDGGKRFVLHRINHCLSRFNFFGQTAVSLTELYRCLRVICGLSRQACGRKSCTSRDRK